MFKGCTSGFIYKGKCEVMDIEVKVEYLQGDVTVRRTMKQVELAALLLDEDVVLLFVNKPEIKQYYKRKKVKNVKY